MADLERLLEMARRLTPAERAQLRRALDAPAGQAELPLLQQGPPRPHSPAWVRAERGHAVLATGTPEDEDTLPAGPDAIAGMWAARSTRSEREARRE